MLEKFMSGLFKEKTKTHFLALDLATSAISAAVVTRRYNKKNDELPQNEVIKIFRYPVNLTNYALSSNSANDGAMAALRHPQILKEVLEKTFKGVFGLTKHLDAIAVNLADPFFLDINMNKKIVRASPKNKITDNEISEIIKNMQNDARHSHNVLLPAGYDISGFKINGYDVKNASGYIGKTLEANAVFTMASPLLQNLLNEAKERFFPRTQIYYFSDARILKNAFQSSPPKEPEFCLFFDINGEMTSVFYCNENDLNHIGLSPFGFNTLARRLAGFLKLSQSDAESLVGRYFDNMLDETQTQKIKPILDTGMADWWTELENHLKILEARSPQTLILIGRGQNLKNVAPFFQDKVSRLYGSKIKNGFLNLNNLLKTKINNELLAGLILFSKW